MNVKNPGMKIPSARFPSFGGIAVPTTHMQPPPQKKQFTPEPDQELIRNLTKLNETLTKSMKSLEGQCQLMNERIEYLQSTVMKNSDLVDSLRWRISQLSYSGDSDSVAGQNKAGNEITPATVIDYLQKNPMIIQAFLTDSFSAFANASEMLDADTIPIFIEYSLSQLARISLCNESFKALTVNVHENTFLESVGDCAKKIFNSKTCYIFVKNPKTGNLSCFFDSKEMEIGLKGKKSLVANAARSQKVVYYTDPQSNKMFSPSLDPLFNPENRPLILIPVGNDAVLYVLHTDQLSFCFTNEDRDVAEFFASLCRPLVHDHMRYVEACKRIESRACVSRFQSEMITKVWFLDLIPFLRSRLPEHVGAREVDLVLVDGEKHWIYDVVESKLVEKKREAKGAVKMVCDRKQYYTVDKLNEVTTPLYDEDVDRAWCNKTFGAFPIKWNDERVLGVIVAADRKDGREFGEWEIEFMYETCSILSLIIPRCFENEKNALKQQALSDMKEFTQNLSENETELSSGQCRPRVEIVKALALKAQKTVKGEYIAIFDKEKRCVVSLKNGEEVGEVIEPSFAETLFEEGKTTNCIDCSNVPEYKGVPCTSFVAAMNMGIGIIVLNSTTRFGHFDAVHERILSAFCLVIINSVYINSLKKQIVDESDASNAIRNAVDAMQASVGRGDSLRAMMDELCRLLSMNAFCFMHYVKMAHQYRVIVSSDDCDMSSLDEDDPIAVKFKEMNEVFSVPGDEVWGSELKEVFKDCEHLIVAPVASSDVVLIMAGSAPPPSYSLLISSVSPVLGVHLNTYIMKNKPEILLLAEINLVDVAKSMISDEMLLSLDFVSCDLTASQKTECVLKMLEKLEILEHNDSDLFNWTNLIKSIEKGYNNLPYHNWNHAINVTQFCFFSLMRGDLKKCFSKTDLTAIMLAALCHDICHTGISSAGMIEANAASSFIFGLLSPAERKHSHEGSKRILASAIKHRVDTDEFWSLFTACIFATDMSRSNEIISKFKSVTDSDKRLLAEVIVFFANISNCVRPFEHYKKMCESIASEAAIEREYLKRDAPEAPLAAAEVEFVNEKVRPIAEKLDNSLHILERIEENLKKWN